MTISCAELGAEPPRNEIDCAFLEHRGCARAAARQLLPVAARRRLEKGSRSICACEWLDLQYAVRQTTPGFSELQWRSADFLDIDFAEEREWLVMRSGVCGNERE